MLDPTRPRSRAAAVLAAAGLATALAAGCDPAGGSGAPDPGGDPSSSASSSASGGGSVLGDDGRGVRVMPVGDSITHGGTGDATWRYRLWNHLSATDPDLEFVGPKDGVENRATADLDGHDGYADPGFGTAHDAMWGRTLEEASEEIGSTVAEHDPDVLLVMLGINDLGWVGSDAAEMEEHLRAFLDAARQGGDPPHVLLAEVLPTQRGLDDPAFSARVGGYNSVLGGVAEEYTEPGARVVPVDVADAESFVPERDTYDGTHPNARGELKIAAAYADALDTEFGYGEPYPRPFPEVGFGPETAPEPRIETGPGPGVRLAWDPVPGATDYRVRWAEEPPGDRAPTWQKERLQPAHERTWTLEAPRPGTGYLVQVRADKGWHTGPYSEEVTVSLTP
ncbi:GDSL-type esterase/lipase family protein [Nocardiopsis baichengensis]|uniref:GDSL-type esterase/lipase family protein n=1 Tax=Nocardiopsis baichengensis TaxID=280240 RepID=UPI00034747A1|nr:GDSL-type esterase/lipase family protein [Nocardiopsis baichengensis]